MISRSKLLFFALLGAGLLALLFTATPVSGLLHGLFLTMEPAPSNQVKDTEVVLYAENSDGHEAVWERRYYYGLRSWGIRGSGVPEDGTIWFDSFPGPSGRYEVKLSAVLEQDGSPPLRLYQNQTVLHDMKLPYLHGQKNCEERGAPRVVSLGTHALTHGSKISLWAQSTYECGEKGAYLLWDKLLFTPVD